MTGRRAGKLLAGILLAGLTSGRVAGAAGLSCAQAATVAEAGTALPPGLLLAIGNVESGRTDATGVRTPWPWTVDTGGVGRFFASADEAVLAVEALRSEGIELIDIGCFQINLFHHPNAFKDLASGFDPLTNALAAARFLLSLHEEMGVWEPAIAAYHSRLGTEGAPYRDRVLASWHGAFLSRGPVSTSIQIRGPEVTGIHVWGPAGEIHFGIERTSVAIRSVAAWPSRPGLPRVVTASVR